MLNGLFGDALVEQESSLAIPLSFRTASGEALPIDHDGLGRALPNAGARLCVLVHGLMSSESVWRFADRQQLPYGELLARERGVSPYRSSSIPLRLSITSMGSSPRAVHASANRERNRSTGQYRTPLAA